MFSYIQLCALLTCLLCFQFRVRLQLLLEESISQWWLLPLTDDDGWHSTSWISCKILIHELFLFHTSPFSVFCLKPLLRIAFFTYPSQRAAPHPHDRCSMSTSLDPDIFWICFCREDAFLLSYCIPIFLDGRRYLIMVRALILNWY